MRDFSKLLNFYGNTFVFSSSENVFVCESIQVCPCAWLPMCMRTRTHTHTLSLARSLSLPLLINLASAFYTHTHAYSLSCALSLSLSLSLLINLASAFSHSRLFSSIFLLVLYPSHSVSHIYTHTQICTQPSYMKRKHTYNDAYRRIHVFKNCV